MTTIFSKCDECSEDDKYLEILDILVQNGLPIEIGIPIIQKSIEYNICKNCCKYLCKNHYNMNINKSYTYCKSCLISYL